MKDPNPPTHEGHEPDANVLAAYADGRLGSTETDAVDAHLAGCRRCRETVALMTRALAGAAARRRSPAVAAAGWLALAATLVLATIVGTRIARQGPTLGPAPAAEPSAAPAAIATAEVPVAAPTEPPAPVTAAPDVRRGGGERRIGSKTFRLIAGEWVDTAYDATAGLPLVEASETAARARLFAEHVELEPFAILGDRFVVVLGGTVYRLGSPTR